MDFGAGDPLSIFTVACENFRASLSDAQRQHFVEYPDAPSMLIAIRRQAEQHPSHRTLLAKCCKAIAEISNKLSPFMDVIGIFVSSHPEFAGLVWGSLRLVFVLGTNHAQCLERVCELLRTMGSKLPAYEEFLRFWATRKAGLPQPVRLFRSMAYVYADLVQFCFDVTQLLSRRRSSTRMSLRGSFLSSLPMTAINPFHLRYDTLLKRWEQHSRVVELEIGLLTGLDQMEAVERIEIILKKFVDVGMFEDQTQHRKWRDIGDIKERLRRWINAPPWLSVYENSQVQRELNSTEWFIKEEVVSRWISDQAAHPEVRPRATTPVLSIQGKPGFGKTTLCSTLIEHLRSLKTVARSATDGRTPSAALGFFFFDKQTPESVSTTAVWRAVVTQLLYTMPSFDPDVIDALIMFRENVGRDDLLAAQPVASDVEIFAILRLLVQRLDRFTLVVDGIDECRDQERFWQGMCHVMDGPVTTSAALFSRPTVLIPDALLPKVTVFRLQSGANLDSIRAFVRPRMASMIERQMITEPTNREAKADQIARRADGMFLWVTLFFDHLQSPYLSRRDRSLAMADLHRLEGLDSLYAAILSTTARRPQNVQVYTLRAFRMVLHSMRPLHICELEHAAVIPTDRRLEPDDLIPGFAQNVGYLSGALMELDSGGFVRFVHLSVREYLTDQIILTHEPALSRFLVGRLESHVALASCSLSYLYHTVEGKPLSGSSLTPPEIGSQVRRYPFLDYATHYWSCHLLECMSSIESGMSVSADDRGRLIELVSGFLSNGRSVMAWIEASWMFSRPPQIGSGPGDPSLHRPTAHTSQVLETAWRTLAQLSQDLSDLNASWGHLLAEEPNEIWEPSISAFNQSRYWKRISGAQIAACFGEDPEPGYQSICLKTRLTSDGKRLGIVRLHVATTDNDRFSLHFERWSTDPRRKFDDVDLDIPRRCLKPFLGDMAADFHCPVAITADLGRVAVPGCVIEIPPAREDEQKQWERAKLVDLTQFVDFAGNAVRNGPFPFAIEDFELRYDIGISDTGRFLITVQKSHGLVDISQDTALHLRLVTVYEDVNMGTEAIRPSYRHVASIAFKPNYLDARDQKGDWCALLHPRYPVLAIRYEHYIIRSADRFVLSEHTKSGLWSFKKPESRNLRLLEVCPDKLAFEHDDEYFWGTAVRTEDDQLASGMHHDSVTFPNSASSVAATLHHPHGFDIQLPYRSSHPTVQRFGETISYIDEDGQRAVSRVESCGNGGVVRQTLREDGALQAEMLVRLPQHIANDFAASVIGDSTRAAGPSARDPAIFIDREDRPFQTHRLPVDSSARAGEDSGPRVPLILHRTRETIPTAVSRGFYGAQHGIESAVRRLKRLAQLDCEDGEEEEATDDRSVKRRRFP